MTRKEKVRRRKYEVWLEEKKKNKRLASKKITFGIITFLACIFLWLSRENLIQRSDLMKIQGLLSENVSVDRSGKSKYAATFKLKGYSNIKFRASGFGTSKSLFDQIKRFVSEGSQIEIYVIKKEYEELAGDKESIIQIYGVNHLDNVFFDVNDYNKAFKRDRIIGAIFSIIASIWLFISGIKFLRKSNKSFPGKKVKKVY